MGKRLRIITDQNGAAGDSEDAKQAPRGGRVFHTLGPMSGSNYTLRFAPCVAKVIAVCFADLSGRRITRRRKFVVPGIPTLKQATCDGRVFHTLGPITDSNYTLRFAPCVAKVVAVCFAD